jgi:hypothetical protein
MHAGMHKYFRCRFPPGQAWTGFIPSKIISNILDTQVDAGASLETIMSYASVFAHI